MIRLYDSNNRKTLWTIVFSIHYFHKSAYGPIGMICLETV